MGQFTNLKGITSKFLKLGKVGHTIDGQAATVNRNTYLPDADVDLRAGTDGQMLSKISSTSVGWSDVNAQRMLTRVFNDLGSPVAKAKVVYLNGVQGDRPKIALAQANSEATSSKTFGFTYAAIPNMEDGQVITEGLLTGLNTDVVGFNEGDSLWFSLTSASDYTNVKPVAPNNSVFVGTLVRKHPTQGSIQVKIQNGYELNELHDVSIPTTPTDGQVLTWETATSLWKAKTPTGGGGSGYTEIAAGGTLSGTYTGVVYCAGNASLAGNVIVKGDLLGAGNLTNTGGYSLLVEGDCIIDGAVDFLAASSTTQQAVTVEGDFIIQGERVDNINQSVIGAGLNEKQINNISFSDAKGGYQVSVTEITPGVEFDISDPTLNISDLTTIANVGNYIGDTFYSSDSEILTMVDQGGGVWRITVDTPIILGSTAMLGTRNVFQSTDTVITNSSFWSGGFVGFGDPVEFPGISSTVNFDSFLQPTFGQYVLKLAGNASGIINEFTFYIARNQLFSHSGFTSFFFGNFIYLVGGGGTLGEGRQINNISTVGFDTWIKVSTPFTSVDLTSIIAADANSFIVMADNSLDGKTITFGIGSVNAGETVTLSFPQPYSGSYWTGTRYNMSPGTTNGVAVGDNINISTNNGCRISSNSSSQPGDVFVGGNLVCKGLDLSPQLAASPTPNLTVYGSVLGLKISTAEQGETKIVLNNTSTTGANNAYAGDLYVGGDVIGMSIEANGGSVNNDANTGGRGGAITIGGSFEGLTFYESFGAGQFYQNNTLSLFSGNYIKCNGGDNTHPTSAVGGNTGSIKIFGDCRLKTLEVIGGRPFGVEGWGGNVEQVFIGGNFTCTYDGKIRPGISVGTGKSQSGYNKSPYFGGDVVINQFMIGDGPTSLVSNPSNAGAQILISGDLLPISRTIFTQFYCRTWDVNSFNVAGPSVNFYGCNLQVMGDSKVDAIIAGTGSAFQGPQANFSSGSVTIKGNCWSRIDAGATTNGSTPYGNGGNVNIGGDTYFPIYAYGRGGGFGGVVAIDGDCRSTVITSGGAGNSLSQNNGGQGGSITIRKNVLLTSSLEITSNGGNSFTDSGIGGEAGAISIRGNAISDNSSSQISSQGGSATGSAGNRAGGGARNITISGSCSNINLYSNGGSGVGSGSGGIGGTITVIGFYSNSPGSGVGQVYATGGSSGTAQAARGGVIIFRGGCNVDQVSIFDGTTLGAAATGISSIRLSGSCTIGTTIITSRTDATIRPDSITAGSMSRVILCLNAMSGKTQLNDVGGATGPFVAGNLYYANNNEWYRIAGTVA